jgi:methanethiol oxidase
MAMKAAPETLARVAAFDPDRKVPDVLAVVDVDPGSKSYSNIVASVPMPNAGDELHHFGWNACSSCLCPNAPHPHAERRYLVVPGLRSSRIHILDTKPDPRNPKIVKVVEPGRFDPGGSARRQVRPQIALLGPAQEKAPADDRLR